MVPVTPGLVITAGQLREAFDECRGGLSSEMLAMLRAHLRAPGRRMTAAELAKALGYGDHREAHRQYARLGEHLGKAAGLRRSPGSWIDVLATGSGELDSAGCTWTLRPELAEALALVRWETPRLAARVRGCLLGGAVGDALGAAVEFETREAIIDRFGLQGIRDYAVAYGRAGAITDDTQMTLFTAEAILRSVVRARSRGICNPTSVVSNAYLRWLRTQGEPVPQRTPLDGWLFGVKALHSRRAPGRTCIRALRTLRHATADKADNDSKGAGGIMRIAPWALIHAIHGGRSLAGVFEDAMKSAWITHGHPTGYLAAGAFAVLLHELLQGRALPGAATAALATLRAVENEPIGETEAALQLALQLADEGAEPSAAIPRLGQGWIAEEALGIAVYCAAVARSTEEGILAAVNITGDSDTTGSLVGQLLGAANGEASIPQRWLEPLELRAEIVTIADDLVDSASWDVEAPGADAIIQRYPGH